MQIAVKECNIPEILKYIEYTHADREKRRNRPSAIV